MGFFKIPGDTSGECPTSEFAYPIKVAKLARNLVMIVLLKFFSDDVNDAHREQTK
jgi:hypothetical protein